MRWGEGYWSKSHDMLPGEGGRSENGQKHFTLFVCHPQLPGKKFGVLKNFKKNSAKMRTFFEIFFLVSIHLSGTNFIQRPLTVFVSKPIRLWFTMYTKSKDRIWSIAGRGNNIKNLKPSLIRFTIKLKYSQIFSPQSLQLISIASKETAILYIPQHQVIDQYRQEWWACYTVLWFTLFVQTQSK